MTRNDDKYVLGRHHRRIEHLPYYGHPRNRTTQALSQENRDRTETL
jgi:hypothetical protein